MQPSTLSCLNKNRNKATSFQTPESTFQKGFRKKQKKNLKFDIEENGGIIFYKHNFDY